jgi:uncharacterized protein (DUF2147 family)
MTRAGQGLGRGAGRIAPALVAALVLATPARAQETPVGVWLDSSERIQVEIAPCGDRLCGTLIWFRWPHDVVGAPLVDLKNADPALRGRPLLGLTILEGLRQVDERTWADGRIYNPNDGVNYQARMTIRADGALKVRAYVLLPLLGKTYVWTRVR